MKEKLMVVVGKNKNDEPIYKEVKKLIVQFIDKNNIVSMKKSKPFWNGQSWFVNAYDRLFVIDKQSIYFDKKLNFYVLIKQTH